MNGTTLCAHSAMQSSIWSKGKLPEKSTNILSTTLPKVWKASHFTGRKVILANTPKAQSVASVQSRYRGVALSKIYRAI